jgi:hypothetical protein
MLAGMGFGLREARETVSDAASKLAETAADTKAAVLGAAALGAVALLIGVIALVVAVRNGRTVTA